MKSFNYKFVFSSIGIVLILESVFMLLSALVGEYYKEEAVQSLYYSAAITGVSGVFLFFLGRNKDRNKRISKRESYLTVTMAWLLMSLFGALPFLLGGAVSSFTDAFFESVCGFTTTGSSTLLNLDAFPKSLHFWRSLTQWIGGIGVIIFVMSFVPLFGGASAVVQLYDAEATGISEYLFRPKIRDITRNMSITYVILTIIGFLLLWIGPMDAFDAACHTFSGISTGGFSTKQASIAYFHSPYIEYVIMLLMFCGGTNFILIFKAFRKLNFSAFKDEEFRWYVSIILVFTTIICIVFAVEGRLIGTVENTVRTALFQVIAAITTTGFATSDFLSWGQSYWFLFLAMILFCGCEGSTSGGIKISRLIILVKNAGVVFKRQVHPQAVYLIKVNNNPVSGKALEKILSFVFLYLSITGLGAIVLSFTGMSFDESVGVAISSMSSYGFGLGDFGPSGNYATAGVFTKYFIAFLMIVGRLEVFTVLSLFVPSFWKK